MLALDALVGVLLVAVLIVLPLLAVAVRRRLLQRLGGTIELSLRLRDSSRGRGWVLGVGQFEGDILRWYRVFSLAPHPRRALSRHDLRVLGRRTPAGGETLALPSGVVVLECTSAAGPVQIAMEAAAVTGFLAWLEARPPGATLPP